MTKFVAYLTLPIGEDTIEMPITLEASDTDPQETLEALAKDKFLSTTHPSINREDILVESIRKVA